MKVDLDSLSSSLEEHSSQQLQTFTIEISSDGAHRHAADEGWPEVCVSGSAEDEAPPQAALRPWGHPTVASSRSGRPADSDADRSTHLVIRHAGIHVHFDKSTVSFTAFVVHHLLHSASRCWTVLDWCRQWCQSSSPRPGRRHCRSGLSLVMDTHSPVPWSC